MLSAQQHCHLPCWLLLPAHVVRHHHECESCFGQPRSAEHWLSPSANPLPVRVMSSHPCRPYASAPRYVTDGAMRESARADGVRDPELVNDINVQRAARLRLYSPGASSCFPRLCTAVCKRSLKTSLALAGLLPVWQLYAMFHKTVNTLSGTACDSTQHMPDLPVHNHCRRPHGAGAVEEPDRAHRERHHLRARRRHAGALSVSSQPSTSPIG